MKSKANTPKTLHLVLKSKWYDKIASGEKTSEYACEIIGNIHEQTDQKDVK